MELFTKELIIRLVTSALCCVAFAIVFRVGKRHLPFISIGGTVTYFIFHVVLAIGGPVFVAALASTVFIATYAEVCARKLRAPTIIYVLCGVVPTVPGGDLYRSMRSLLLGDYPTALSDRSLAIMTGVGIAGGIVLVSIVSGLITDMYSAAKKKRAQK